MAQENRDALKAYFQTGDIPTQGQFENLIDSCSNNIDDRFISSVEQYPAIAFGGNISINCALGKSFFIMVTENLIVDVTNVKAGETYTFLFQQASSGATVTLRPVFRLSAPFEMVSAEGVSSMFSAYGHDGILYCNLQADFPE